jgi:hypothetical protein
VRGLSNGFEPRITTYVYGGASREGGRLMVPAEVVASKTRRFSGEPRVSQGSQEGYWLLR